MRRRTVLRVVSVGPITATVRSPVELPESERAETNCGTVSSAEDPGQPDACPPERSGEYCSATDDSDAEIRLVPPEGDLSLPTDSGTFRLVNESDRRLDVNFYGWDFRKYVDGEWVEVGRRATPLPMNRLPAGETHTWDVTLANDTPRSEGSYPSTDESLSKVLPRPLGPGTYAMNIGGYAATVRVTGDPVTVSPPDHIEVAEESETSVTLRDTGIEDGRTYVLREAPDADPEETVVFEHLTSVTAPRGYALSLLAHGHECGVEEVRLEHVEATAYPGSVESDVLPAVEGGEAFAFQGSTYRLERA